VEGNPSRGGRAGVLMGICVVVALSFSASPAWAVDNHAFDPVLSLTGGPGISPDDEVPDPGPNHPAAPFKDPCGVAVDRHGFIYVASIAPQSASQARIDVFNAQGQYLTQVAGEYCALAVDSEGNIYAHEGQGGGAIVLLGPETYPPVSGSDYASPVTVVEDAANGVAVDPSNDHVYVPMADHVNEYDSAKNGSALLDDTIGTGSLGGRGPIADPEGIDVYGANHDVYVTSSPRAPFEPFKPRVYVFDGSDGHLKLTIDGSDEDAFKADKTPTNGFNFTFGRGAVAVDQANGDVYVGDIMLHEAVYQFDAGGHYIGELTRRFKDAEPFSDIAVDDPLVPGEEGYDSPNAGYVFVTSGRTSANSHLYAFAPRLVGPPEISGEGASQITDSEVVLSAEVNPHGLATSYRFEYTPEADFQANGFSNAARAPLPEGAIEAGGAFVAVSTWIPGLAPSTAYRFRIVASNECKAGEECTSEGPGGTFTTYPAPPVGLPEGRAYELVSPPETNGRIPTASLLGRLSGVGFPTPPASPSRDSVIFGTEGGSLPGLEGSGFYDLYQAVRAAGVGWQTRFAGLTGAQAATSYPGGVSADHGFSVHLVDGTQGSLTIGGPAAYYLRHEDGGVEAIGRGSLGEDRRAQARWISSGGGHVIFVTGFGNGATAVRLEPDAPAVGIRAIYDRSPGGPTHVVSLLPGNETPSAPATYLGSSTDGRAVAFKLTEEGTTRLYLRLDNTKTVEVASGDTTFGGLSRDGSRLFYLKGGDVFVFEAATNQTTQIGGGGESTLVNVSADGSHAYFVSPKQLDGESKGIPGEENLYAWNGAEIDFIGALKQSDVSGEAGAESFVTGGLGLWTTNVLDPEQTDRTGIADDPSRTTPDGGVLVFESRADLAPPYDNAGHTKIYRYDARARSLACISCNPTGAPADSDDRLQSRPSGLLHSLPPLNAISQIPNVTDDGQAVFFESEEPLAAGDVDGKSDVYEWKAGGAGACGTQGGCISLISSGHSSLPEYLYGMQPDGSDVFFLSSEILVPQDLSSTPSIYDARIGGGFAAPASPSICEGDACQGEPGSEVVMPQVPSQDFHGLGNATGVHCPKGKRRVKRRGKVHCVKKHRRHHHRGGRSSR
jgi:hypothetical protein